MCFVVAFYILRERKRRGLCVCVCVLAQQCMWRSRIVFRIGSVLLSFGFWRYNSGCWAWHKHLYFLSRPAQSWVHWLCAGCSLRSSDPGPDIHVVEESPEKEDGECVLLLYSIQFLQKRFCVCHSAYSQMVFRNWHPNSGSSLHMAKCRCTENVLSFCGRNTFTW